MCPSKLNLLSQIPENGPEMADGRLLFQPAYFQGLSGSCLSLRYVLTVTVITYVRTPTLH